MAGRGQTHPAPASQKPTSQGPMLQEKPPSKGPLQGVDAHGAARQDINRMQPRGRWGDDGVDAYGDGHHKGSSSAGGGRGHAWHDHSGHGRGFSGPPGKFAPGVAGPPKRGRIVRTGLAEEVGESHLLMFLRLCLFQQGPMGVGLRGWTPRPKEGLRRSSRM
ncbi:hypothetical protein D1007_13867 [Hordeum vulgare]|nr:hypothetical protein D1007_13867 [Hordeum vulgare]